MEEWTSAQPEFWQTRYQAHRIPWDLGQPAPPLVSLLEENQALLRPGKMAALGAGYGHDAAFFGKKGFDVIGFDYVPEAVEGASQRYGEWVRFVQADIFALDEKYEAQFDFVLEHTCFCAIQPSQRTRYVEIANGLLKPGGYFMGLIWAVVEDDGPPYPSNETEIQSLFQPRFEIEIVKTPRNSVPDRQEQEILCLFKKPK